MAGRLRTVLLLGLALAACAPEELPDPLPPLDRFYFPTGVATTRINGGADAALLVASSNFDLRYSAADGGTLVSVAGSAGAGALAPLGAGRISSYSGAVAVADAVTCPGITKPKALVASRFNDTLYRFDVGPDGSLSCGPDCAIPLGGSAFDPYPITVACGPAGKRAYVGYLRTPNSTLGSGPGAWVAEVDLEDTSAAPRRILEIGDGAIRSMAYEREADRLWVAAQSSGERTYLYSVLLSDPTWAGAAPWQAMDLTDLAKGLESLGLRGVELRSLAMGTRQASGARRLYATARLYDVEAQAANSGTRPSSDVGGVLLALDVVDDPVSGLPVVTVAGFEEVGVTVADVAVVSRGDLERDVVLVTVLDGDVLWVFDDLGDRLGVAQWVGHDTGGFPVLGDRPMAIAVDPTPVPVGAANAVTVYVGSFGSNVVSRFLLDPLKPWEPISPAFVGGLSP